MNYPGRGGWADIKNRLKTVEDTLEAPQANDGVELVGGEIRLNYRDLPLAPGN